MGISGLYKSKPLLPLHLLGESMKALIDTILFWSVIIVVLVVPMLIEQYWQ